MRAKIIGLLLASIVFLHCNSGADAGPFECAPGTQDRDGDGLCLAACAPGVCGHGSCDDADGTVSCKCETEYAGHRCERCAPDYVFVGTADVCTRGCALTACGHGTCFDCEPGIDCLGPYGPRCQCEQGYAGDTCEACAPGFTPGGNGTCLPPECDTNPCGAGKCTLTDQGKVCTCAPPYAGAYCEVCTGAYHMVGTTCVPD